VPHLSMHFLGPCQIILDGERAPRFRYQRARALLAYLAVEAHRAHQRGELAGLLWPDQPGPDARRSLRDVLHDLRQVMGDSAAQPPFFLITSETVQFNVASSHWLDVAAFGSWLVAAGRVTSAAGADPRTPLQRTPRPWKPPRLYIAAVSCKTCRRWGATRSRDG
jgi:DNA-binding SARP family transcriptional activator